MKRVTTALAFSLLLLTASRSAHAFPSWMQEGKAGRWMFNFKFGPAITAKSLGVGTGTCVGLGCNPTMGAIVLDFGVAVDSKYNAYIILPSPEFQVHDFFSIVMLPVGFQYDIAIHKVPGLYITPRFKLGYAAIIPNCAFGAFCPNTNAGYVEIAAGGKFIFKKRWNVGFEPMSLAVFFGNVNGLSFSAVSYRLLWYGGVNF